jgi:hypothetical protein
MKRIFVYLLPIAFVMSLAACNSGNTDEQIAKKEASKVGNITWKHLSRYDTIPLGDTARMGYVYFNSGWKPVKLIECVSRVPYCDCKVSGRDVPAGGTDTLWVTASPIKDGPFVAYLDITHDNPKQHNFMISAFVEVKPGDN